MFVGMDLVFDSATATETHRLSLTRKLDIRTVAGLTRFALETGLVTK